MKKASNFYLYPLLLLCLLFSSGSLSAQSNTADPVGLAQRTMATNRAGMLVLGSWAVGNIALGGAMQPRRTGPDNYFHQMNLYWNLVNLGIAGFGYYNAMQADAGSATAWSAIQDHYQTRQLLLFNMGLNTAYMAGGLYLIERSKRGGENADRLLGYGRSIIMQGAFLLLFDTTLYLFHQRNVNMAEQLVGNAYYNGSGFSVGWNFSF